MWKCVFVFRKEVVMAIKEVEIVNSEEELELEKRNSQSTVSGNMAAQHG